MASIGIVILAAGASTRLGQPKQLLPYLGKPLVRHIAEVAIDSGSSPVVVVLGSRADLIRPHLTDLSVHIAHNDDWGGGIANSIRCGLAQIRDISSSLDGVILMLCDQPFVSTRLIRQLIAGYETANSAIVAARYAGICGVPALFDKSLFSELAALRGDVGARRIIRRDSSRVLGVPFAGGAIDLDTPEDVERHAPRLTGEADRNGDRS